MARRRAYGTFGTARPPVMSGPNLFGTPQQGAMALQQWGAQNPGQLSYQGGQFTNPTAPAQAPQPPPFYADLETARKRADRDFQYAGQDLNYDESRIRQGFGFDDLSNPYARAAILSRNYRQQQAQDVNAAAAGGKLYRGSLGVRQAESRFRYDQSYDTARREYDDLLQGILRRRRDIGFGRDDVYQGAADEQLRRSTGG